MEKIVFIYGYFSIVFCIMTKTHLRFQIFYIIKGFYQLIAQKNSLLEQAKKLFFRFSNLRFFHQWLKVSAMRKYLSKNSLLFMNLYHFCGNRISKSKIMFYKNHGRRKLIDQIFNLHPRININIVERFVPYI